tara:strand:+ start:6795 stop:7766 length:972 start_codon:yes stop_codon:yes gene_type:complete
MGSVASAIGGPIDSIYNAIGIDTDSGFGKSAASFFDPLDFGGSSAREAERAIKKSIQEEQNAYRSGIMEQRRQADLNREMLMPYINAGSQSLGQQSRISGLLGQDEQQLAFGEFNASPGQQYLRSKAQSAVNKYSPNLGTLSPQAQVRLGEYSGGVAETNFGNYMSRLQGIGQLGQQQGNVLAQGGQQLSQGIGQMQQGIGQAGAQGTLGMQQMNAAQTQGQDDALLSATMAAASFMSQRELKTDIKELNDEDCYNVVLKTPLYSWKYLSGDTSTHLGPMYEEAHDSIKDENKKAIRLHSELNLIAGALKHMSKLRSEDNARI